MAQFNYAPKQGEKERASQFFESKRSLFPRQSFSSGADNKMIAYAEVMGARLATSGLTTSQIRNIFSELHRIVETQDATAFYMLKPKVAYIAGRHDKEGVWLFKYIFDEAFALIEPTNKTLLNNFLHFMEAIVAYHKANGGKD